MTTLAWKLVGVLGLLLVISGLYAWGRQGHQEALQQATEKRAIATQLDDAKNALRAVKSAEEKRVAAAEKRAVVAKEQRKRALAQQRKLDDAIKANPEWATQPVPDSVWDSILGSDPDEGSAGLQPPTGS